MNIFEIVIFVEKCYEILGLLRFSSSLINRKMRNLLGIPDSFPSPALVDFAARAKSKKALKVMLRKVTQLDTIRRGGPE